MTTEVVQIRVHYAQSLSNQTLDRILTLTLLTKQYSSSKNSTKHISREVRTIQNCCTVFATFRCHFHPPSLPANSEGDRKANGQTEGEKSEGKGWIGEQEMAKKREGGRDKGKWGAALPLNLGCSVNTCAIVTRLINSC